MPEMPGTQGMFPTITGNLLEDSERISVNVEEDFGKYSRGFWGMFHKIPGNV